MTVTQQPRVLTEQDSLKVVCSATGGSACPVHEVGPVANHLLGPVSALRPYGHPDHAENKSGARRSKHAVDGLILDSVGGDAVECTCGGEFAHPLAVVIRPVSEGAFVRAHLNDASAQRDVEAAITSADVDRLLHYVEPRLEAVARLFDRARAEHGGDLPSPLAAAAGPLVQSLAGRTRWGVREGYHDGWRWSDSWRPGVVFDVADRFMTNDVVAAVALKRVLNGTV
jgi:hypothetical protein